MQIAIVMVAADLRIRRFTPTAEKVLNLIPTDIGRPISDIKPNIDCPELEKIIAEVIDTVSIREREVRDRDGRWYSMRVRPYKNTDNRIDGAVVALFDSDAAQRMAAGDDQYRAYVRAALDAGDKPLLILDAAWTVRLASPAFARVTGLADSELNGANLFDLTRRAWKLDDLRERLKPVATGSADSATFDVPQVAGPHRLRLRVTRKPDPDAPAPLFVVTPEP